MKGNKVTEYALMHPKLIIGIMIALTLVLGALIPMIKIDTDPENMLSKNEAVRVFHDKMKKEFAFHDMVVLGIVNEKNPNGVFNPDSLKKIYELTEYTKTLRWQDKDDPEKQAGVIEVDLIAPSTVDNIEQGGLGVVNFSWLMKEPPDTQVDALLIRDRAQRIPFLKDTLLSDDGKALCLYIPLTSKDLSHKVYTSLKKKIGTLNGDEQYYITGLPVAEDTFGVEMFVQMAVSAPLAMFVIFLLMLYFFRKLVLIISPMIVAMVSVIWTMGLLIGTGNTVHIMSSMIPIFIMPIAVLDSIHILSEFFERYQQYKDRKDTIRVVMKDLFKPMLYTSLTSAAGFGSLALTPIPPVQVFGVFIAIGVMSAWVLTIIFIPAYIMLLPKKSLENFGATHHETGVPNTFIGKLMFGMSYFTFKRAKLIIVMSLVLCVIAIYGISKIQINDNPIRWFTPSHPIRVADRVLNHHFGGTYMSYLTLQSDQKDVPLHTFIDELLERVKNDDVNSAIYDQFKDEAEKNKGQELTKERFLENMTESCEKKIDSAGEDTIDQWEDLAYFVDKEKQRGQVFKDPRVLNYITDLQKALLKTGFVGKSNSLSDIVKTVHRELLLGKDEEFRIPDTSDAVAQCLLTFQNSHRPHDLWHFVSTDYKKTALWIQLKSGDNKDMSQMVDYIDQYIKTHKPPVPLSFNWFGLTYINVVWQQKMVSGMMQAFIGSFLVVFLMMTFLFRSALWGFLCMIPLTVTIGFIYGAIGLVGKDYDMPIAVLSSLTLGLAVDFSIHFLSRARVMYEEFGSWKKTVTKVFGEPARAIARNVIVIAVGFLPLLAAPLMPYKTVGVFLAAILAVSGIATLVILPAMIKVLEKYLFGKDMSQVKLACNCATCGIMIASLIVFVALNIHQFAGIPWSSLMWYVVPSFILVPFGCCLMRRRCKTDTIENKGEKS
ncbi:MAG: MMPL family transporter [Candidatus Ancaeobacter aquaticus]|nr:MMPL family transporter [Candidatus Ancaeobacter aquaticus]